MPFDALRLRKTLLFELELTCEIQQTHLALLFREHLVKECEMVAEEDDAGAIVHRHIFAQEVLVKDRRHRSNVLVAEAKISPGESGIARFHCRYALFPIGRDHVAREDLLGYRHRSRFRVDFGNPHLTLETSDVEWKQTAVLDHLPGNLVFTLLEDLERNLLAATNFVDKAEVGGSKHAQVLTVLLVNALDILRDHELDSRRQLCIWRLLAAGALAATLAADSSDEAAFLHVGALDGQLAAAL